MGILFLLSFPVHGRAEQVIDLDQTPPSLDHQTPVGPIEEGKPYEITAEATDQSAVARVMLYYRTGGQAGYQSLEMINTDRDNYAALIPGNHVKGKRIEYYIDAEDRAGNRTMRGDSEVPLSIDVVHESASSSTRFGGVRDPYEFQGLFGPGIAWMNFSDHGAERSIALPGISGEIQVAMTKKRLFELKTSFLQADGIALAPVVFQGAPGTLYESYQEAVLQAGESFKTERGSFSAGLSSVFSRTFDRNLLNSGGQRLTRYPDETNAAPGLYLGYYRTVQVTGHFKLSTGVEINLFLPGGRNYFYFPIEAVYGF